MPNTVVMMAVIIALPTDGKNNPHMVGSAGRSLA
jgi:hypothetical protein